MGIDKQLDIRGETCPYTYVKSKLAIEGMEKGQVLEITLKHKPAINNVPRSMENEGHKILDVSCVNENDFRILVEKG